MRIGIIRHFKVNCHKSLFMTSKEFKKWENNYNKSNVIKKDVNLMGIKWEKCYSSTLIRAIITANHVYKKDIVKNDLIRETIIDPIFKSDFKLPYWFWAVSGRFAWFFNNKSQEENRTITKNKARKFVDELQDNAKRDELDKAVSKLNKFLEDEKVHAEYSVHKDLGTLMIKIVEDDTKKIVLELPPEKILDMVASMCKQVGLLDKKA